MKLEKKTLVTRIMESIIHQPIFRRFLARKSHSWFFSIYFSDYVEYETAPFQHELFDLTERDDWNLLAVMAFRDSAKSTILNTSFALWSILGSSQRKFVLILTETKGQARQIMMNIRGAVERDAWLRNDMGPFKQDSPEWTSSSIVFEKYGSRISVLSTEQIVRGLRHNQYRPDLLIVDDCESSGSVKTKESREKTYTWLKSEVFPAAGKNAKKVIIGNLLHLDCLMLRLRKEISEGKLDGIWREYPLISKEGVIAWPGKFPDMEAIEKEKRKIGNEIIWQREFLLNLVAEDDQVIKFEWLEGQDYEGLPDNEFLVRTVISVDPASSKKENSSNTAMVVVSEYKIDGKRRFYVHPNPINEKLSGMEIEERIKNLYRFHQKNGPVEILMETTSNNYLSERLNKEFFRTKECRPRGDKRERLIMAGSPVQAKTVFFHKTNNRELKTQLLGFGHEKDDLVDAFSQGINELTTLEPIMEVGIMPIEIKPSRRRNSFWQDKYDESSVVIIDCS